MHPQLWLTERAATLAGDLRKMMRKMSRPVMFGNRRGSKPRQPSLDALETPRFSPEDQAYMEEQGLSQFVMSILSQVVKERAPNGPARIAELCQQASR